MSGNIVRTANLVAEMPARKLANGIQTTVPVGDMFGKGASGNGTGAMGFVPESCVLTAAIGDQGANVAISMYVFSQQAYQDTGNGWLKAGAASGKYQLTFEPRGCDSWDAPENTPYCLVAASAVAHAYVRDRSDSATTFGS